VVNVLGAFREHFVLIGGWVPELLFPNQGHIGSLDVDLALAPTATATAYQSVLRRMIDAGYTHLTQPTRFEKLLPGVPEPVKVDVLSGQYEADARSASIQVNELHLSSLKGIDLAFEAFDEVTLEGLMPNGTRNQV